MPILHVNYHENRGGAGRVVWRVHRMLLAAGLDSQLLFAEKSSGDRRTRTAFNSGELRKIHCMQRLEAGVNRVSNGTFQPAPRSYNFYRTSLIRTIRALHPDLVILHWVNGCMVSIEQLRELEMPVVWMLHDSWCYCGAEHCVADGDLRNRTGYGGSPLDLDAWTWRRKCRAWRDWQFPVLTSSAWMDDQCRSSLLLGEHPVKRAPIPFFPEDFHPVPRVAARRAFGFPTDSRILLFCGIGPGGYTIKGCDLLAKALRLVDPALADRTICVLCGGNTPIALPLPVRFAGPIGNDALLCALYSAVDAVVCPSRREAFGQIVLEAAACGTASVAFSGTGCESTIVHGRTGYLAHHGDVADFARGVETVLDQAGSGFGNAAREFVCGGYAASQAVRPWEEILDTI